MMKSMTQGKARGLAASLALRQKTGLTSHQLHEQKIKNFCAWLFKWGWSSTAFLDQMMEGTKRGFTKKMVEKGLAVVTPNETVSFVKGWPNDFVTLTQMAIEYLQQFDDVDIELDYPKNGMNLVNKNHARHDLFCQKYILQKQKTELFDYQNSRSATKQKSESGVK